MFCTVLLVIVNLSQEKRADRPIIKVQLSPQRDFSLAQITERSRASA
jgi:hypothetical protein